MVSDRKLRAQVNKKKQKTVTSAQVEQSALDETSSNPFQKTKQVVVCYHGCVMDIYERVVSSQRHSVPETSLAWLA